MCEREEERDREIDFAGEREADGEIGVGKSKD